MKSSPLIPLIVSCALNFLTVTGLLALVVVICAVLLVSGCLRSLQFTALNAIAFSDVSRESVSQVTSLSSVAQRLGQAIGVVFGAYALELSSRWQGHERIVTADFWPAFIAIGLVASASALFHFRLSPDAGAEVSGHRVAR